MSSVSAWSVDLFLCRHGQDEDNAAGLLNGHRDQPLTALGREQAAAVAARAAQDPALRDLDVILASPLQRAFNTAEAIADALRAVHQADGTADEKAVPRPVLKVHPPLIERDFGILTGKPATDIDRYSSECLQTDRVRYFLNAEGAEDFDTLRARAAAIVAFVEATYGTAGGAPSPTAEEAGAGAAPTPTAAPTSSRRPKVMLVAHGDIGKMILAVRRGLTWKEALLSPYIANTDILTL